MILALLFTTFPQLENYFTEGEHTHIYIHEGNGYLARIHILDINVLK